METSSCHAWCFAQTHGDRCLCLPYPLLTMLLISYMFACVINNVYFEKSMCIIVFDLAMNFKVKDSIFFLSFLIFKQVEWE